MDKVDTIERSITVNGSIEQAWEALTDAKALAKWFGDSAEVDLRVGGKIKFAWSEYESETSGVIEEIEPPSLFSYRWDAGTAEDGVEWTTLVRFTLSVANGKTTIAVLESGFSKLPDELYERAFAENSSGWSAELKDLVGHLEHGSPA